MTAYLAYSISSCLTEKERAEIDSQTKKAREDFMKGFVVGGSILAATYSIYLIALFIIPSSAHAAESNLKSPIDGSLLNDPKSLLLGTANVSQSGDFWLGMFCIFGSCVGLWLLGLVVKPPKP